jgi:hypothetical protein
MSLVEALSNAERLPCELWIVRVDPTIGSTPDGPATDCRRVSDRCGGHPALHEMLDDVAREA